MSADKPFENLPASLAAWEDTADHLRAALTSLIRLPAPFMPTITTIAREAGDGFTLERFTFQNGIDEMVYGVLLLPTNTTPPFPAILYHHLHDNRYALGKEELFDTTRLGFAPGVRLAQSGYAVLSIDAYAFSERQMAGEPGALGEAWWAKRFLWEDRTLWGMMLADDMLALDILAAHPAIDPARIGATGMSLGGSRTTWLAALDIRIKAAAPIAQMTHYAAFAAAGNYNLHGIYYYVPGMLTSGIDMQHLAALAAPRAQTILIGDADPLSPIAGVQTVIDTTRAIYALYGAPDRFTPIVYPGVAHAFTPQMFTDLLAFLDEKLKR